MKKSVKIALISVSAFVACIMAAVAFFFILISPRVHIFGLAELDESRLASATRTVTITDSDGVPIDAALYDSNKIYVEFDELNRYTVDAFVAIEDKRFYSHHGIDYKRVASAALSNIKARKFREGASTISQQLIKNTHLSNEKTLKRKISEMRLARQLEAVYSKDEIFESYVNILYFGSGIHGLGTASRVMFDKSVGDLSVAQSAALAAIINNPSKYSPYKNFANLEKRKNLVLGEMFKQGRITETDYNAAVDEQLVFSNHRQTQFVDGVLKNACAALNCTEKELFSRNYTLNTAFDPDIARVARSAVNSHDGVEHAVRIVVLDNATGAVVCDETNRNKYINEKRSPASTIKPFVSYAPALENGYNPLSQIDDSPTDFGAYSPSNYKNVYRGKQSLKDCLIYSSNIAAVKLLQDVGIENGKSTAEMFGLNLTAADDSLAVALGGLTEGVTLLDIANAYRTLANGGMYSETYYLDSVQTTDGARIYSVKNGTRHAVNDDIAYLITDMLIECADTGTAKRLASVRNIAAKTGTNGDENGNLDCYCVAYTPRYTIAVWYGADYGETLISNKITGANCCSDIKYLAENCDIGTNEKFDMPSSVAYYEIDDVELRASGNVYLADPLLPGRFRRRALFSKRHLPIRKNIDIIDFFDSEIWFGRLDDPFDYFD